jgi:transcription antitermination factor NusG
VDRRDELTWVIVELTHLGEAKVDDGTLEDTLRSDLEVPKSFPIFVPAATYTKDGRVHAVTLMEGYAFVGTGLPDMAYFALEHKPYVNRVIASLGGPHKVKVLSTVADQKIREMRLQLRQKVSSDIKRGDWVLVTKGTHRSLEGEVMGIAAENAFVRIELRSLRLIATIPLVFLELHPRPDEDGVVDDGRQG